MGNKVKENLSPLDIPEERITSIFLFDFFDSNWRNCLDSVKNDEKMIEYCLYVNL